MLYFVDRYGVDQAAGFAETFTERWGRTGRAAIPVGLPVDPYTATQYGSIVYGRGRLFLQALAAPIGQDGMNRLLRDSVARITG